MIRRLDTVQCDILEIDVFSSGAFTGNPVAVIAGGEELAEIGGEAMQRIAAWLNYSETTFLLPPREPGADYRVRIFSTSQEFPFAGHPTLGTAKAWLELSETESADQTIKQECGAGLVPVRLSGQTLSFATPPRVRTGELSEDEIASICAAFDLERGEVVHAVWADNGPGWTAVELGSVETLHALELPRETVKVGFAAFTGKTDTLYEVRAFSNGREDPVTGSLNGAVAQWMRETGRAPRTYSVAQGLQLGRAGRIEVCDDSDDIWIGGGVDVRVRGTIALGDVANGA
ncbi:PhzF family phenazine biosynthesis protein [Corynebacterium sp. LK2510]|uniref:PhzF family phenazine biosynthesis protein n=1 Tax=Corynebacterium sp. LK2510 TaxID=3110472 RepID=UPI0034CF1BC3